MNELDVKKVKWTVTAIFIACWLWFGWWSYQTVGTAYGFWQHGVEKHAVVGKPLMGAGLSSGALECDRGCWYGLDIEGEPAAAEFYRKLEVGSEISVLVMPGEDGDIVEGDSQTGLWSLLARQAGGLRQMLLNSAAMVMLVVFMVKTYRRLS